MRFIKRSEPDHSMVTVRLKRIEGAPSGEVFLPMRDRGEALTPHSSPEGGALTAVEALGLATAQAFEFHTDIAVVDEDGLWRREWGTLHAGPNGAAGQDAPAMEDDGKPADAPAVGGHGSLESAGAWTEH